MERKIDQLSEENGDLSFKVQDAVSSPCPHSLVICDGMQEEGFDGSDGCWVAYSSATGLVTLTK